jgi:hypothetical protein
VRCLTTLLFLGLNFLCACLASMSDLPRLTIACINCNSLNSSNVSSLHYSMKLYGISKLNTDVIFLSDIRIHGKNSDVVRNLKKTFHCNPYSSYEFFSNSLNSSRGTGIFIKKSLDFSVEDEYRDPDCNLLGLRINTSGKKILLISIYGPNINCDSFFPNLSTILIKNKGIQVVMGGGLESYSLCFTTQYESGCIKYG